MSILNTVLVVAALCIAQGCALKPPISISHGCTGWDETCVIALQEGLDTTVELTLDEPIICLNQSLECSVIVNFSNTHPDLVVVEPCYVRWEQLQWHQTRTVQVTAVTTYVNGGNHDVLIETNVVANSVYYSDPSSDPEDLYIRAEHKQEKTCSSTGDPHITTFDEKYWRFYDSSKRATLYRATNRDFTIQAQMTGSVAHNCALAGREGPDRVIIGTCGGQSSVLTVDINSENEEDWPEITVENNIYTVYFKSGAWMRAYYYSWGMNTYIGGVDYQHSCGLCGNFDGFADNDAPGSDYKVYNYDDLDPCQKVPSGPTGGVYAPGQNQDHPPMSPATFDEQGDVWNWKYDPADFNQSDSLPTPAITCPYELKFIQPIVINTQDVEDITDELMRVAQTIQDDGPGLIFNFITNDTEVVVPVPYDIAYATCQLAIAASITVQVCTSNYADFAGTVENTTVGCAIDYQEYGGNATFLGQQVISNSLTVIVQICLETVIENGNGNVTELTQVLCSNSCSEHGTCEAGAVCECNDGFAGGDCSIDLNSPPRIHQVSHLIYDSSGLNQNNTPGEILIYGDNILATHNLTCRFGSHVMLAFYLGPNSMVCNVPEHIIHRGAPPLSLRVQISNNGVLWSTQPFDFLFYDGYCQVCTPTGTCTGNPDTCNIGGQCYLPNTQKPATIVSAGNPCMQCVPTSNNTEWTFVYHPFACGPIYDDQVYTHFIIGNASDGDTILTVEALNNPLVVNNNPGYTITYEYVAGNNFTQMFDVHATTGVITALESFDITQAPFFGSEHAATNPQNFNGIFQVRATDPGGETAIANVIIELVLATNRPEFSASSYSGSIAENATLGMYPMNESNQRIVFVAKHMSVAATGDIEYEWFLIPFGYDGMLNLNKQTGVVTVGSSVEKLNYEIIQNHQLTYQVRAMDASGVFNIAEFYLTVTNVDEAPTDILLSSQEISEGSASRVIGNLTTVDPEGGVFNYTIEAGQPAMSIMGNQLMLAQPQDYETMGSHQLSVNVTSTDSSGLSLTKTFVITITDVNEPPTNVKLEALNAESVLELLTNSTGKIAENATINAPLALVTATDPDIGDGVPECYAANVYFVVTNNKLVLQRPLDYEADKSVTFGIICEDALGAQSLPLPVTVTVLPVNEAPMFDSFTPNTQNVPVVESLPRSNDLVIGNVSGFDLDGNTTQDNFQITTSNTNYTIANVHCFENGVTRRCQADVVLKAGTVLDYEGPNVVLGKEFIPVTFTDSQDPALSITIKNQVYVTIENTPDLPTGVDMSSDEVTEGAPEGTVISNITIIDQDVDSADFNVTLINQNPGEPFRLQIKTLGRHRRVIGGLLWQLVVNNASAFDFEENPELTFKLEITDNGKTPPETLSFVETIEVKDKPLGLTKSGSTISAHPYRRNISFSLTNQDRPLLVGKVDFFNVVVSNANDTLIDNKFGYVQPANSDYIILWVQHTLPDIVTSVSVQISFAYPAPYDGIYTQGTFSFTIDVYDPPVAPVIASPPMAFVYYGSRDVTTVIATHLYDSSDAIHVNVRKYPGVTETVLVSTLSCGHSFRVHAPLEYQTNRYITNCHYIKNFATASEVSRETAAVDADFVSTCSTGPAPLDGNCDLSLEFPSKPDTFYNETVYVQATNVDTDERLASVVTMTVTYLDACNMGPDGLHGSDKCPINGESCKTDSSLGNGYFCHGAPTDAPTDLPTDAPSHMPTPEPTILNIITLGNTDGGSTDTTTVGSVVGVVMILILILLVLVGMYLHKQKKDGIMFDSDADKTRLPTFNNPTYETTEGLQTNMGGYPTGPAPESTYTDVLIPGTANPMYDWYRPAMTRKECSTYLMGQGEGAFVLRDSESNPGWHMLGVKTNNIVVHDKIRFIANVGYQLLPSLGIAAELKQPTFETLPLLINYYIEERGEGSYTLVPSNPIYDNHQLIQERTGTVVKKDGYDSVPNLPSKDNRTYDAAAMMGVNLAGGGDSLSNPMYGQEEDVMMNNGDSQYADAGAAGYLDVEGLDPDA